MMLIDNIRQAYNSLLINKKRSVLTMVGIIIGLSSVLFITSIGDTITSVLDSFLVQNIFGGVNVTLFSGYSEEDGFSKPIGGYSFNRDEIYDFIDSTDDLILDIGYSSFSLGTGDICNDFGEKSKVSVTPVSSAYEITNKIRILAGRFISRDECRNGKPVAVISDIAAEKCFGSAEEAVGKTIDISVADASNNYAPETEAEGNAEKKFTNVKFVIVGVYQYIDGADMMSYMMSGSSEKSTPLYSPYSYAGSELDSNISKARNPDKMFILEFIVKDSKSSYEAQKLIADFAESKYGSNPNYNYFIDNSETYMKKVRSTIKMVTYAFSIIGAISLLVGGIGLMNTMLVSVTERTKEIGIKKALGAKNSAIRLQFLTESAFLCLASCGIGILFGFFFGMLIETNLDKLIALVPNEGIRYFLENTTIHVTPSLSSIIFSSLFSIVVGVVFGYYPANKGAKMQPVDALRYE